MTMLKAARGMRGNRPWSRMNTVNAVASAICLTAALSEWSRIDGLMTWPDVAVSGAYVAALLALPFLPVPASVTVMLATLAEVMMPQDSWTVSSIWGLWYAMIVLTMHGLLWPAAASIAVLSCLSWVQGDRLTIMAFHPSMMFMFPFLAIACMLGLGMRMWRLETRRRERAEARRMLLERENAQYRERLDLLHELHGSVAGSLAYAVLVCRQMREECDAPSGTGAAADAADAADARFAAMREEAWQAERAVTRALEALRREVIEPTKRLVAQRQTDGSARGGGAAAVDCPADGMVAGAAGGAVRGLTVGVADGAAGAAGIAIATVADAQDGSSSSGREVASDRSAAVERHVREAADRLRALGFRCETLVRGDLSGLDGRGAEMVMRIVDEAGNNIAKYGLPGCCAIAVTADGPAKRVRVWSSNDCADDGGVHARSNVRGDACIDSGRSALSGGTGLDLLRRSLATVGGNLTTACEDGVWTVAATVPMAGSPDPA